MASNETTKGRIAPSPSGRMHLGNAFSALLAWAHARSQDGGFLLRLEDLDERCRKPDLVEGLVDDLRWLGVDWDEEPVVQSRDIGRYEDALERIESRALVYPCFCSRADLHAASAPHASDGTPIYAGTCLELGEDEARERAARERHALRLHVPDEVVSFVDELQGACSQHLPTECGDFVLRRSDGVFAYQLACVVDDAASGVTEIVRGRDLISSTPRQMLLYGLLDAQAPRYAHHPLLLAQDGRRLAKRDDDLAVASLRAKGASPQDVIGHVAFLAGQIEALQPMDAGELVEIFDASRIPRADVVVTADDVEAVYG